MDSPDPRSFREAASRQRSLVGIWLTLTSAAAADGLSSGFDRILIDGEHAPVTLPDVIGHLRLRRPHQ